MMNTFKRFDYEFEHEGHEFFAAVEVELAAPPPEATINDVVDSWLAHITPLRPSQEARDIRDELTPEQREEVLDLAIESFVS